VQDGVLGDLDIIAELRIEIESDVPRLGGLSEVAAQQQRVRWLFGILDDLCDEIVVWKLAALRSMRLCHRSTSLVVERNEGTSFRGRSLSHRDRNDDAKQK
jgi:hypothetical protein